jgi:hypothetical protein
MSKPRFSLRAFFCALVSGAFLLEGSSYAQFSGAVWDSISPTGTVNYWSSTYNQGTFIGAANFLGDTNNARLAADYLKGSGGALA